MSCVRCFPLTEAFRPRNWCLGPAGSQARRAGFVRAAPERPASRYGEDTRTSSPRSWRNIAENGYPAAESGVLWEEARDAHLERLAGDQPRVA